MLPQVNAARRSFLMSFQQHFTGVQQQHFLPTVLSSISAAFHRTPPQKLERVAHHLLLRLGAVELFEPQTNHSENTARLYAYDHDGD